LKKYSLKELELLKNLEKRMIPPEMQYKANLPSRQTYELILKIKDTNEQGYFIQKREIMYGKVKNRK
jgi:hypothetical protein